METNLRLKKRSQLWLLYSIPLIIRGQKTTAFGGKILKSFPTQMPSFWKQLVMHLATHGPYLVDKQDGFPLATQYSMFLY